MTPNDYQDVLDLLAAADGAMLYWQMPDVTRATAALNAGAVILNEDTDLLIHPDAVEIEHGMLYTMKKETDRVI